MKTIRIFTSGCDWLYNSAEEWMDYCGTDNFTETYVIKGNRDYRDIADASWYKIVLKLMEEFDNEDEHNDDDVKDICTYYGITKEQYEEFKKVYDKYGYNDNNDIIVQFLNAIYPDDKFDTYTIRGYAPREWNEVIYKASAMHDLQALEDYYFGHVNEIYCEEENISGVVTDNDLWESENSGSLKELCCDALGIGYSDDIKLYISDGFVQVVNWREV